MSELVVGAARSVGSCVGYPGGWFRRWRAATLQIWVQLTAVVGFWRVVGVSGSVEVVGVDGSASA